VLGYGVECECRLKCYMKRCCILEVDLWTYIPERASFMDYLKEIRKCKRGRIPDLTVGREKRFAKVHNDYAVQNT